MEEPATDNDRCPGCGGRATIGSSKYGAFVYCTEPRTWFLQGEDPKVWQGCGTAGPRAPTKEDALRLWNQMQPGFAHHKCSLMGLPWRDFLLMAFCCGITGAFLAHLVHMAYCGGGVM